MEFGYFAMPSHPPERGLKEGHDFDLQTLRWLDELGFSEAWIGEHHTAAWEPHPAPDLLIAQALLQTKRLRIGPGGFLLPYHHPAELANRVAMLDHLSEGPLDGDELSCAHRLSTLPVSAISTHSSVGRRIGLYLCALMMLASLAELVTRFSQPFSTRIRATLSRI